MFCVFQSALLFSGFTIKAQDTPGTESTLTSFNSKLVRLKDFPRLGEMCGMAWFQFQTGSIKSLVCDAMTSVCFISFNSKLVRLKVSSIIFFHLIDSYFNSKLVRLKGKRSTARFTVWLSFNSKLVRLKEENMRP